ncbi:MAG: SdrD B-like domain-containing protein, partial [Clostridia bacterium]
IEPGETLTVTIEALADRLPEGVSEKAVSAVLNLSSENIEKITTNTITHMIQINPDLDNPTEDPDNPTNIYSIEGIAWLDENKNGIREENESFLSGIKAQLILAKENRVLTETYTDENGNYYFGNLEKGDYFIIFDYDVSKYDVTLYQADGSTENTNSDAISTTINEDGNLRKAAVTDTISIVRTSRTNIDIGLFENPKFDMKLDKYVSKITVQNGEGTKTYAFENVETAKADITGKQLNNSTVTIEYTFVIQNEGQIEGFVKKIADYLPSDLKFNSELNPNWYLAKDGNLYNEELKEDLIKPGEGREVKLILIKKMTEENVGLIHNTAEIIESYNEQGIQDVDSTGANKVQGEDDFGVADVYISVKTGAIVFYTTLTILVVVILGIGTYFIKKKVLVGGE